MQSLISKNEFSGLGGSVSWLYNGAETPPHKSGINAVNQYLKNRSLGPIGRDYNEQIEKETKINIAKLVNTSEENVAFLSSSSEIISMITHSLNLREGDNIVIHTLEFPAGVLPCLSLKKKGVEVRVVEHRNWEVTEEDLLKNVDESTKLVITSHVSYLSGARIDYKKIYSELKRTNTLFLLDVTQSLGVLPVESSHADFLVCSSYKWLLASHGVGILVENPTRTSNVFPSYVGWRSVEDMFSADRFRTFKFHRDARRFELGFPNYPTIYQLNETTNILYEIGVDRIKEHILKLGTELIECLQALDIEVITPSMKEKRAGNIAFKCKHGEALAEALIEENIYIWGGDGRARASIHLFNDTSDMKRLIDSLKKRKNNYF